MTIELNIFLFTVFFLEICKNFTLLYSVGMIYAIKFYGEKVNKWKLFKCDKESTAQNLNAKIEKETFCYFPIAC